jgi:hypothetical protein
MFCDVQAMSEQSSEDSADAFALEVQGLTRKYGELVAVQDLNLPIKKGGYSDFSKNNIRSLHCRMEKRRGLNRPIHGASLNTAKPALTSVIASDSVRSKSSPGL